LRELRANELERMSRAGSVFMAKGEVGDEREMREGVWEGALHGLVGSQT
jgi:hypothetical protein